MFIVFDLYQIANLIILSYFWTWRQDVENNRIYTLEKINLKFKRLWDNKDFSPISFNKL